MTELEKEFEKHSGIGKTKAGLIVCTVLVVVLAISSLWLYTRFDSLQNQIDTLEDTNNNLQSQVNILTGDKNNLQNQVDSLKQSKLHMLGDQFLDLSPEPYANFYGIIFNSGTNTAYNVVTTWNVYDIQDTLIATREVSLGHIEGKSSQIVDIDIQCQGTPDRVTYEMTWDYTL